MKGRGQAGRQGERVVRRDCGNAANAARNAMLKAITGRIRNRTKIEGDTLKKLEYATASQRSSAFMLD